MADLPDLQPVLKKPKRKYTKRKKPESEEKQPAQGISVEQEQPLPEIPLTIIPESVKPEVKAADELVHRVDERLQAHGDYISNIVEDRLAQHLYEMNNRLGAVSADMKSLKSSQEQAIDNLMGNLSKHLLSVQSSNQDPPMSLTAPMGNKPPNVFEWNPRNRNHY